MEPPPPLIAPAAVAARRRVAAHMILADAAFTAYLLTIFGVLVCTAAASPTGLAAGCVNFANVAAMLASRFWWRRCPFGLVGTYFAPGLDAADCDRHGRFARRVHAAGPRAAVRGVVVQSLAAWFAWAGAMWGIYRLTATPTEAAAFVTPALAWLGLFAAAPVALAAWVWRVTGAALRTGPDDADDPPDLDDVTHPER
jgi:hypothetical protein